MRSIFWGTAWLCVLGCGGGDATTTTNNPTNATATATTSAVPPAQEACGKLATRIDAFTADVEKSDAQTGDGLRKISVFATSTGSDVSAMKLDDRLAPIASDTATYLGDASKRFTEMGSLLDSVLAAAARTDAEAIKACVAPPAAAIATACKPKATHDCTAISGALTGWAQADKTTIVAALDQVRALAVTEPKVKGPYAQIVACVGPLSANLAEVERGRARIHDITHDGSNEREHKIDDRFKAVCGRGLFSK
jgi:hypothetical protein